MLALTALAVILSLVVGQQIGTNTPEVHPKLPTWKCTTSGGCVQQDTSIVLDYNYRFIHEVNSSSTSCMTSSGVDTSLCPNEAECAQNCAVEGVDYASHGISTSGNSVTLQQYVQSNGATNSVSPRVYLLGSDGNYEMLQLLGQELRYDVDVSTLPCGENSALFLSEMDSTGGRSQKNPAGAGYGAGYCDAQCPVQTWINGTLNTNSQGYCCVEMDIAEANSYATALTPHPCEGNSCAGTGCNFNPYAQGNHGFYGQGGTVNTLEPMTVITQFHTDDNTATGKLIEIRRMYIQNGQLIPNAVSSTGLDSITASWCSSSDSMTSSLGGLTTTGEALGRGMVLVFNIWNMYGGNMNWLDSGDAGPCSDSAGDPATIQSQSPGTSVTFSNVRWGDIGSTFSVGDSTSSPISASASSSSSGSTSGTGTSSSSTSSFSSTASSSPTSSSIPAFGFNASPGSSTISVAGSPSSSSSTSASTSIASSGSVPTLTSFPHFCKARTIEVTVTATL